MDKSTRLRWVQILALSLCNVAYYLTLLNLSFPICKGGKTITTTKGDEESRENSSMMPSTLVGVAETCTPSSHHSVGEIFQKIIVKFRNWRQ